MEGGTRRATQFASGAASGVTMAILLQPLDVVKTVMQGQYAGGAHQPPGRRISASLRTIIQKDGPQGLWRGMSASVLRVSFGAGFYFATVSALLGREAHTTVARPSAAHSFFAGATARMFSGAILLPLTVLKTRFEWGGAQQGHFAVWRTAKHIVQHESIRGLFSGMAPTLVRDAASSGLYLLLFDQLKAGLQRRRGGEERDIEGGHASDHAAAALAAGTLATVATHPLDVIKTRSQLWVRDHAETRAPSALTMARTMLKEEGWGVFMRGAAPRVAKRAVSLVLVWGTYERVARLVGLS